MIKERENNISGLDYIAKKQMENQDAIIERSPISVNVEIRYNTIAITNDDSDANVKNEGLFGYETYKESDKKFSKAIIKFNPDRIFLKNSGIFYDGGTLPIIAYFKNSDDVQRGCFIKVITTDHDEKFEDEFQVSDIKSRGYSQSMSKIYILTPTRGTI
jgi:hypothetical protein